MSHNKAIKQSLRQADSRPYGLYLHIPFCRTKCDYCDFLSFPDTDNGDKAAYTQALVHEINQTKLTNPIDTIYIGGGTPTALPLPFLRELLQSTTTGFTLADSLELTVEANPGTLTRDMLAMLKENGVNRLSIGLQAWQNHLLAEIGRSHTREAFVSNYHAAREAGFANINIDLMFALPRQALDDWRETLRQTIALQPRHISAYSLTPEDSTPMGSRRHQLPGDEADREMYHTAKQMLCEAGYTHYEISNWAKPGFESRHNIRYWKRRPYLGLGLGAHSFDGAKRWRNTTCLQSYLSHKGVCPPEDVSVLSDDEARYERLILGLRLTEGLQAEAFDGHEQTVADLIDKGLLCRQGGYVRLTSKGMDLANQVFIRFND